jgi:hypothetical protein
MKPIHEQPSLALALRRLNELESLGLVKGLYGLDS